MRADIGLPVTRLLILLIRYCHQYHGSLSQNAIVISLFVMSQLVSTVNSNVISRRLVVGYPT